MNIFFLLTSVAVIVAAAGVLLKQRIAAAFAPIPFGALVAARFFGIYVLASENTALFAIPFLPFVNLISYVDFPYALFDWQPRVIWISYSLVLAGVLWGAPRTANGLFEAETKRRIRVLAKR